MSRSLETCHGVHLGHELGPGGLCRLCKKKPGPRLDSRIDALEDEVMTLRSLVRRLEDLIIGDGK